MTLYVNGYMVGALLIGAGLWVGLLLFIKWMVG